MSTETILASVDQLLVAAYGWVHFFACFSLLPCIWRSVLLE